MRNSCPLAFGLFLLVSCGGGGSGSGSGADIPAAAKVLDAGVKSQLVSLGPMIARVESNFVFIMNPGIALAQGVAVLPDNSAGAAANSFTFSGAFDGNGDGHKGTTIAGRASFGTDPATGWSTLTGDATLGINIPALGQLFQGSVAYSVTSTERRLSGSGTVSIPLTGITGKVNVAPGAPLVVRAATGAPGAVANACGYSLDGSVQVEVQGPAGLHKATWNFSPNSSVAAVKGATFADAAGQVTALPDSGVDLRCGSGGTIGDWTGTYIQDWACLPRESGQARFTITATGPDSINIVDEDPPGSGQFKTYAATIVGVTPRAVKGFFIGGPVGNQYREDFNWSLGENGAFSQFSQYTFLQPPGTRGICTATARRVP